MSSDKRLNALSKGVENLPDQTGQYGFRQ